MTKKAMHQLNFAGCNMVGIYYVKKGGSPDFYLPSHSV